MMSRVIDGYLGMCLFIVTFTILQAIIEIYRSNKRDHALDDVVMTTQKINNDLEDFVSKLQAQHAKNKADEKLN